MLGLTHVALHLGLCSGIARKSPETPVAVRVRVTDSASRPHLDKVFNVRRGYDPQVVVEFDMERGTYKLQVAAAKFKCAASDWVAFIPDLDRNLVETLSDGPPPLTKPMLVIGTLPQSFQSAQPTYLLFNKDAVACNKPIVDPLPAHIVAESDQDAYYAWLYSDPSLELPNGLTLAVRLRTPAGEYHYLRIPMKFPEPWYGWPVTIQFNLSQEELLFIPSQPVDTLLCPKMLKTSVG